MAVVVSVGVVARNEAAHIEATLRALLALDFPADQYEIIVVDGGSTDGTRDLAGRILAGAGVQGRVLNERDFGGRGLCFSRNLVLDQSAAEARYIAFIDADCIAEPSWLRELLSVLQDAGEDVAGAGGGRAIAPTEDEKELVINTFLTSHIGSGFNPVFSSHPAEVVRSIANYNALYRKDVLGRFRYDESLGVSDDNEVNYRIARAGFRFRFVASARNYHRETNSVREFARNMFAYGMNIANAMRKHKTLMRPFVPFSLGLIAYLLGLPLWVAWLGPLALLPLGAYGLLGLGALCEVALATRSLVSLWVLALFPLEHVCYGLGVLANLLSKRVLERAA